MDEFNDIVGSERILLVAWMLPNEGELTDAQRSQAMGNFAEYCKKAGLSAHDVAHAIGSPRASTITELVKGIYRANADEHIRKLNLWIEQHARAKAAALTDRFVATNVAKQMLNAARLVRENQTMGLVVGATGIGKSRCALAIHERYVGSVYVAVMTGQAHVRGLTHALAVKLGARSMTKANRTQLYANKLECVIDKLQNSGRLVIIDEASKLNDEALQVCRDVFDNTGAPFLLIGTCDLHERIVANADPDHGQLYSRFDVIVNLTQGADAYGGGRALYTIQEIRELYNEPPVKLANDAAKYLLDIANMLGRGSLRRCKILLRNAVRRARRRQGIADDQAVTVTAADLEYVELRLRPERSEMEAVDERRRQAAGMLAS
jgi:hypothetical protein